MLRQESDPIVTSGQKLENALAVPVPGHEQEWTVGVQLALLGVENALREHKVAIEGQDGMFASLNGLSPDTLPTMDRQMRRLCADHDAFLQQSSALRNEVQNALQAFQPRDEPASPTRPFPKAATPGGVPDFGSIRQRGAELVEALRKHNEAETKLLLETATTDVGVGD